MATVARHQEISDQLLAQAVDEFRKGDLLQASEEAWGAVAHHVKSVAQEQGWPNSSHRDVCKNADRLVDLTDNPRHNGLLFDSMENLPMNFYEDTYEERPEKVRYGIEAARDLIDSMRTVQQNGDLRG